MNKERPPGSEIEKGPEYHNFQEGLQRVLTFIKEHEDQQSVIIVFGIPGSGKSHFIYQLENALDRGKRKIAAHIDSYKSDHPYKYAQHFKVFIIHASGAWDFNDTLNTVSEKMGKSADLTIYIKNESVKSKLMDFGQRKEQNIENQCDIIVLNPFQKEK